MLELIEANIKENSEIQKISVDGIEFDKSDFVVIDRNKQIIRLKNSIYINLKAVKELKFRNKTASILEVF